MEFLGHLSISDPLKEVSLLGDSGLDHGAFSSLCLILSVACIKIVFLYMCV
jgi:hypothetical protein